MADVRSLLRQQQAARRITHPHALYTESGKLSCLLCGEPVKTEALWDAHVRSPPHRQRLQALAATRERERAAGPSNSTKRKLDVDDDDDEVLDDSIRKKRSRADIASPQPGAAPSASGSEKDGERSGKEQTLTPLSQRTSNTPVQGVEMKIPSRPATPMALRDSVSNSSTPNAHGDHGYFSVRPQSAAQRQTQPQLQQQSKQLTGTTGGQIDESEWAAFEAEIAAATAPYSEDAVISAPAVPANDADGIENPEEAAAPADKEIEAEREDATRALEEEFDEMEELEARARRLKEKREALRLRKASLDGTTNEAESAADPKPSTGVGKENQQSGLAADSAEEDEDDDEDYDEDDYAWGGLRYAGRA
ncbi:hypothetical protein jhhlp_003071 [Lomentospora prolificans]|uniref:Uncharacterized protein n=1 Tax=Lomentospora prolificans TaxID=41688 RepID=A0A2N3NFT6_9PEZI|nr:hypothetical protein jhhlp_003071 [Lomentospora prolificans]